MPGDFTVSTPPWTGLAHFASISFFSFSHTGATIHFCDIRSQIKLWRFSVYYRFVYGFSRSFQLTFCFMQENFHSKIIGFVDIMLTVRSAHCTCICFYAFKISLYRPLFYYKLHLFAFKSYLHRCICFCLSPFLKNIQEFQQWNVDLFISLIPGMWVVLA